MSDVAPPPTAPAGDARADTVLARISKVFVDVVKADKLAKSLAEPEFVERLSALLNTPHARVLSLFEASGALSSCVGLPKKLPKGCARVLMLLKVAARKVEVPSTDILFNELAGGGTEPLEHLAKLLSLYIPLLTNSAAGFGDVVTEDMNARLHTFLSTVAVTVGHVKGETCLPLPLLDAASTGALSSKDRVHLLEGCVSAWSKQIVAVLRMDPEAGLRAGLYPLPSSEVEFWRTKALHLDAVYEQLQSERVRRVLQFLEASRSAFCEPFAKLCHDAFAARAEARDNVKFLGVLESRLIAVSECDDFAALPQLYRPLLHLLLLTWKHSRYYNSPARIVVLVRQVANAIIAAGQRFLTARGVFELLAEEAGPMGSTPPAISKLKLLLRVVGEFKRCYFKCKAAAAIECPNNPWRISNAALFSRLDAFLERAHDALDLSSVVLTFVKLEKITVGGAKGRMLTGTVEAIHADFKAAFAALETAPYDALCDLADDSFRGDFASFKARVLMLERRLAAILVAAFEDSTTLFAQFKLLDSFDTLLERPLIQDEIEKLHIGLCAEFGRDLKRVQELFLIERHAPPIAWNLPPISGTLAWCVGLRERITEPMSRIRSLSKEILAREETKEVMKLHATLLAALEVVEGERIQEWGADVERSSGEKLLLPLLVLRRDAPASGGGGGIVALTAAPPLPLLEVNFDPALVRLLREVKYFLLLGLEVPASALEIYKKAETFRRQVGSLELIVGMYNTALSEMLPVEAPLFRTHLSKMDAVLQRGVRDLNWKAPSIDAFINEAMTCVKTAHDILFSIKANLREIVAEMELWFREPLLQRKSKPMYQEEFETTYRAMRTARYTAIQEGGKLIDRRVKESAAVMKLSKGNKEWDAYVDFVNGIVVQGLVKVVTTSLRKLCDLLSAEKIKRNLDLPLLIIELTLSERGSVKLLRFSPDIHEAMGGATLSPPASIYDIVNGWVDSFYHAASCFKRLDDNEGRYVKEMMGDVEVQMLLATLNDILARTESTAAEFRSRYDVHAPLWQKDMAVEFSVFVAESYFELPKTDEQLKAEADLEPNDLVQPQPRVPDLSKFDAELLRYHELSEVIASMRTPTDLSWLRINSAPIKASLQSLVSQWSALYSSHIRDFVVSRVNELAGFAARVQTGLEEVVLGEDTAALRRCMIIIRDVTKTRHFRKAIIPPLRSALVMLKRHGVSLDETKVTASGTSGGLTVVEYLDQMDLRLDAAINRTFIKKEEIYPLQTAEMDRIKAQAAEFDASMRVFWANFRRSAPFSFPGPVDAAYAQLDGFYRDLVGLERGTETLNEVEGLFELPISRFNETTQCRTQLRLLKTLWDFKGLVQFTHEAWKTALWADINTDVLEDSNKKIAVELKRLGDATPVVKAWGLYKDIEVMIKDMAVTLPLVNELHSPSMRPRHWATLATVCNVKALDPSDAKFALDDMMSLRLHTHSNEVSEIVDTANKELKIERKMDEVEAAWKAFTLDFVPHKDMDVRVVKASDEVIETLDAHQMELQSIVGMGKVMEHFRSRVDIAQRNLGIVEEVLKEWLSVTHSWAALESIFLASADIRAQLPDDTKRFEGIDASFKELMKAAVEMPNVVEACTKEGRGDSLREATKNLELCQRSLNEYLDMKKKIFPRFYFVSNVALLDILSNGNNPPKILPYLGDCYDSIQSIDFAPPLEDAPATFMPSVGLRMVSKDGECVDFFKPFIISGAVERWLNELTVMQTDTLRFILEGALESAVNWEIEKPRHTWLEDYPAQIVLVGTQIYWTEEAQAALDELEAGQEDAVKKYLGLCNDRLNALISRVLGDLTPATRNKIIALITLDVHARDVIARLVDSKAEGPSSFMWSQQLRFYWAPDTRDVNISITDFRSKYSYEYLGNSGRLVITPLTDRCYITLTLALRLFLGGAPAGPAGTGKTETTKDLARAVALPCYVFNCSDQMNYQTMADIFKGLAQTGAWGCFDEFNRINIEVLSVVATQVKSILDAAVLFSVPANRDAAYAGAPAGSPPCVVGTFELNGDVVSLIPTVGMFITMNPGYAGRTELPENLKALFRSCAMIRPDLALICENMLMSEGFQSARPLSIKFVTLYQLSSELLSPQNHYDWGLRSVKSVLRVAGALKRADKGIDEDGILMRALRDFNTPKMPLSDLPIFLRLIQDLFPRYFSLPTKFSVSVQTASTQACAEAKPPLQADAVFIAKVVQLQELMDVRHSVMLLGPGGCGKTTVWKTLAASHNLGKPKNKPVAVYDIVDPKAVTSDELYGYMTLAKDWKDGVLAIIMRGMSKNQKELGYGPHQLFKWVVLDGDIDAVWIESMNTVMDDNKILSLVSNERIPLSPSMRMVFEINSLANATPATVSRAGILFINESDIGWRPYVETWMQSLTTDETLKSAHLPGLFNKYVDAVADGSRRLKSSVPVMLIAQVVSLCRLMDGFLECIPKEPKKLPLSDILENFFFIALAWSFGGALVVELADDGSSRGNHRRSFHDLLTSIAGSSVKLPKDVDDALVFDYFFNPETEDFEHWATCVPKYAPVPIGGGPGELPFSALVVSTVDSIRLSTLMAQLSRKGCPVMFVGTAGTGKTTLVKSFLSTLDDLTILSATITMNYYMDSAALQARIDANIDKRSGRIYGPPNGKRLVLYVDDMNLPYIETYGTQNSLSLLRQIIDHRSYYDRSDLGFRKEVADLLFMGSMNPTAGSFTITDRLQRNFTTFACLMPSDGDLSLIFRAIQSGHLASFPEPVTRLVDSITDASIRILKVMVADFLPDAERFMYNWNMRELANVFQGVTLSRPEFFPTPIKLLRLWLHEVQRVFCDRMVDATDAAKFDAKLRSVCKVVFKDVDQEALFEGPLLFTNFAAQPSGEPSYLPLPAGEKGMELLSRTLVEKLEDYNSSHSIMDLVLFEQAMEHVCRIVRIISNPGGHALLVGVGGSGKQSLSKLAAHICGYDVRQLAVTSKFNVADLKEALKAMYSLAGVKGTGIVFLLTDSQIVSDKFLVFINDILSSGWIADLFERDELDAMFNSIRNEAKSAGVLVDSPEEMLKYFISRTRANFHIVLCFSPVGATFRVRARRFPGLINCSVVDKFHPWPADALMSVANRFIEDLDLLNDATKTAVAEHMAEVHMSVTTMSVEFRDKMRRHNYVTPKSFLELIAFYRYLLGVKREGVGKNIKRLDDGLAKLKQTAEDVAELKIDVQKAMASAEEEVRQTDVLVAQMQLQTAEANEEKAKADAVADEATAASNAAGIVKAQSEQELSEATPAMEAAKRAVAGLDKNSLNELKGFKQPPKGVERVTGACAMMMHGEFKKHEQWDYAKKMMSDVGAFLVSLEKFDARKMSDQLLAGLEQYVTSDGFTEVDMKSKSSAAANLCAFVVNIYKYNRIYVKVEPLMLKLEEAEAEEAKANKAKAEAEERVAKLTASLAILQSTYEEANAKKTAAEEYARACSDRLDLANRLVNGLSSENERWGIEVDRLRQTETMLIGDTLVGAAFVSYIGAFNNVYRRRLWCDTWTPDMLRRGIPMSEDSDPLAMLTDEGKNAKMMSEGLPTDRISVENGSIITSCKRWPLIIDPQLQGIKWLKKREEANKLTVLQLTQASWLKTLTSAIVSGTTIIIENVGEELDATLDPVLARAVFTKGRTLYIKVGGEEVEYDARFKLFLQTKLSNPHYRPEIQAQCTIVNFIATESGLQDQLLARVVNEEKAELEKRKQDLAEAFNNYKLQLLELEDNLLTRLANAPADILSDVALIHGLEATKKASVEINAAVTKGRQTEQEINLARQVYVPVAEEGAMLYFIITQLNALNHMYQYSLDSFILYFYKAIREAAKGDGELKARVEALKESLRLVIFTWVARGLQEADKLILMAQLTFTLMARNKLRDAEEFSPSAFQFLLRAPRTPGPPVPSALEWLPEAAWQSLTALAALEGGDFVKLPDDLIEAPARFLEWFNLVAPETEKLPLDWAQLDKTPMKKLLVLRCMRPDRISVALRSFVALTLPNGVRFTECDGTLNSVGVLEDTLRDATAVTPLFFILSPGADVVGDLDKVAKRLGYEKGTSYHNVSMGQGQDVVAMEKLEMGHKQGHWVILNNVHLMPRWLVELEKKLDAFAAEGSHERFRVFLTSDPSPSIPIGILNRSIKLTNEPPQGLKANLKRAFCIFTPEFINELDTKLRAIVFGLSFFHAVVIERKKFGAKGYNMMYPFALGDLRDSVVCLQNYMESSSGRVPWEDLRYIFGEIMYGGHVVNDFDRLLVNRYLEHFLRDELLEEMELFPFAKDEKASFKSPNPTTYDRYLDHIDNTFPAETPIALGLHPNAAIQTASEASDSLMRQLLELQPRDSSAASGDEKTPRMIAAAAMADIWDSVADLKWDVDEFAGAMNPEDVGPFQNVLILELRALALLTSAIRSSLTTLRMGFEGRLTMSESMERLEEELSLDKVPGSWAKLAWPSLRLLGAWRQNLSARSSQLNEWMAAPGDVPKCMWLGGLVNPQSYLTAIRQTTAQRQSLELDRLTIQTDVTKRFAEEVDSPSRDGAFVSGLYITGVTFDVAAGTVEKSRPRQMETAMPVINVRSVLLEKLDEKGVFFCPVYKTQQRGPTYVFTAQLKTKAVTARWVLCGACLLLDPA